MKKYILVCMLVLCAWAAFAQDKEIMNNRYGYSYEYYRYNAVENKSFQDISGWDSAVRVSGSWPLYFKNVDFLRNHTGISLTGGKVGFIDVNFTNNDSGGIRIASSSSSLLGAERVLFSQNQATNGAGIYSAILDSTSFGAFKTVRFDYNTASQNGGGMYVKHNYQTMQDVQFTGNRAMLGGGIYAENDFTLSGGNISFVNNAANQGGGIYSAKNLTLHAENGNIVFTNNTGNGVYMGDSNAILRLETTPTGNIIFNDSIGGSADIVAAGQGNVSFYKPFGSSQLFLNSGSVYLDPTQNWDHSKIVAQGGFLSLTDEQANELKLGTLTLDSNLSVKPEVDMLGGKMDSLNIQNVSGLQKIHVDGFHLLSVNSEAPTTLSFMKGNGKDKVNVAVDAYDDIFRYQASYDSISGDITFTPQKLLLGQGTASADAFAPKTMMLPLFAYEAADSVVQMLNSRSALRLAQVWQFDEPRSGLYFQPYYQSGKKKFTNDAQVDDTRQGVAFGGFSGDLEYFDSMVLSAGWYGNYQQEKSDYSALHLKQTQYQVGGDLFLYSYHFFMGLTAQVGMSNQKEQENSSVFLGGAEAQLGFNWDLSASELFLQPFGKYSYAYVGAGDDARNGAAILTSEAFSFTQAQGGVRLLKVYNDNWSAHLGGSYVKQMPLNSNFSAGNVLLPKFELDGYAQVSVGFQWSGEKRSFSADIQAQLGKVTGWGLMLSVAF